MRSSLALRSAALASLAGLALACGSTPHRPHDRPHGHRRSPGHLGAQHPRKLPVDRPAHCQLRGGRVRHDAHRLRARGELRREQRPTLLRAV